MICGCASPQSLSNSGCDLPPERPLHFAEKVLPILHGLGTDSYLVVKKHQSMEAMLLYLGRWCAWVGGAYRAGQAGGSFHLKPRQEQLGQKVPRGQASLVAGAVSFILGCSPGCLYPWAGGWCSPRPLRSSPSQPRRRHQARHDEVP